MDSSVHSEIEVSAGRQATALKEAQAPLFLRALEVFGAEQRALAWLESSNPALHNRSPIEAMSMENGETEVFNILGRIEHGVIS